MLGENPSSPNAIPTRSSSTGGTHTGGPQSSKAVLKPLPEDSWISPSNKRRSIPTPINIMYNAAPLTDATNARNGVPPRLHSKKPSGQSNYQSPRKPSNPSRPGQISQWSSVKEKIILGPYDYTDANPGKDIRSALITAFNAFLHVPDSSLTIITKVVGMLHTSSLLIDDVEDGSLLRRGIPVAHSIFGTAQTINSANYVYFLALQELHKLGNWKEAIGIFTEELLNLHRGQGMDLYWRDTLTCPTEDDYLEMVQNKTGGLFRLAVKLMQAESSERDRRDCVPLVNLMGLIFQICDDYLNLSSTTYTQNKGLCEDLTEGKFSFPVIHSIRSDPSNLQLINILKQKTTDEDVKRYALKYMEGTGSFEYTRKAIRELRAKAHTLIEEMDSVGKEGEGMRKILDRINVEQI
jgi:geranylgeranyl diphosphate synthase, type III